MKFFIGKPEGKKPLGRHRRRREDNITIDGYIDKLIDGWMDGWIDR
jgi:hypothetical protein